MDIWERNALRLHRQEELKRIDEWLVLHPTQATFLALGGAILVFELSQFLRLALDAVARWIAVLVLLTLCFVPLSASAAELPDAPTPKVVDKKFVAVIGALGGSMAFDMKETRSLLDRGGVEYNTFDFGPRPSNARLVAVESAYFAGFTLLAYEMKKPHSWIPRPIGRVLEKTWWIVPAWQIANHVRLGIQDRRACRPWKPKGGAS